MARVNGGKGLMRKVWPGPDFFPRARMRGFIFFPTKIKAVSGRARKNRGGNSPIRRGPKFRGGGGKPEGVGKGWKPGGE